jgi:hypothetical protein
MCLDPPLHQQPAQNLLELRDTDIRAAGLEPPLTFFVVQGERGDERQLARQDVAGVPDAVCHAVSRELVEGGLERREDVASDC